MPIMVGKRRERLIDGGFGSCIQYNDAPPHSLGGI
jgi:hypothetical protein